MSCHVSIYTPTIVSRKEIDETNSPHGFIAMYYTNNLVTQMKEVVGYNFTAFISDIGGSLGFLLGNLIDWKITKNLHWNCRIVGSGTNQSFGENRVLLH